MKDIIDINCVNEQDFEYFDYLPEKCRQKKFLMYNEKCDVCFMVDDKFLNQIQEEKGMNGSSIKINRYEEEKNENKNKKKDLYSKKCINKLNMEALEFLKSNCKKGADEVLDLKEFVVFKSILKKKISKHLEKIDIINSLIDITSDKLDNKDTKFLKNIYEFNS